MPRETRDPKSFHYRRRHIDHARVLNETLAALDGLAHGLGLIDVDNIPPAEREEAAVLLAEAMAPLRAFQRSLTPRAGSPRSCAHCGREFDALSARARYCSVRCRVGAHRERAAQDGARR